MAKPPTTACWYKIFKHDPWKAGLFHQWGTELGTVEGEGNFSVGIVEDNATRKIVTPLPYNIHFGANPDEEG